MNYPNVKLSYVFTYIIYGCDTVTYIQVGTKNGGENLEVKGGKLPVPGAAWFKA